MKAKITKRLIDDIKPDGAAVKVYDTELRGFGLLVQASGRRVFFVEYGPAGKRRRMQLGAYGALTPEQARTMAKLQLAEVVKGNDPAEERAERATIPTFGTWKATYMERVERRKKRPDHDRMYLARAAERWGARRLDSIRPGDVHAAMQDEARRGNTTANRWLASVAACFTEAIKDGHVEVNPAAGIETFTEAPPRARVLSDAEFARTVEAFDAEPDPHARAAMLLLLETGARRSEALRARWEDFDLDAGTWRLPSPKAGHPQVVPLGPGTVAWLRAVPRLGPWLVPGRDPSRPRGDLRGPWERVRKAAALDGVTIHDLRRTFGLHLARRAGLHVASRVLRHSDIRITQRVYAPLGLDELRAAVADTQRERDNVIELHQAEAR